MFGKNQEIKFGTMYPNQKIAQVTDLTTGKKTLYKLHKTTHQDKLFYNHLETVMLNGSEYVATKMPTMCK